MARAAVTPEFNLKRAGADFVSAEGVFTIAATHSQARYALPPTVRHFNTQHPGVSLRLHQGSPKQVADLLLAGETDMGVVSEALMHYPALVAAAVAISASDGVKDSAAALLNNPKARRVTRWQQRPGRLQLVNAR